RGGDGRRRARRAGVPRLRRVPRADAGGRRQHGGAAPARAVRPAHGEPAGLPLLGAAGARRRGVDARNGGGPVHARAGRGGAGDDDAGAAGGGSGGSGGVVEVLGSGVPGEVGGAV
ncbi:MAG: Cytochrome c2, partial [uncultured Acetobacteraceae bacterium]